MILTDLPDDVIESICDQLDIDSRASMRKVHPRFDFVVSEIENRLIAKCLQVGASLPPKIHREHANSRGFGIDYEKISHFDPFGSDLYKYAWQGPRRLTSTTLREVRDGEGEILRPQKTGLRPSQSIIPSTFNGRMIEMKESETFKIFQTCF
ncbi:hypothetical protein PMAYCL1PPCAC_07329 [Pristionchus mayeri]|uniref:F-box domain-containing protein n=1 Tax=Pristionchus mayeri TaxID=1317129 RepID=A0AAN4ZBW3_9BILA|nr:hypothetical protein PMAYCL1PPCAC_07329 [Pristionchus mayeri]